MPACTTSSSPQHAHTVPVKHDRQQHAPSQLGSCRTPRLLAAAVRRRRHMQTSRHSEARESQSAGADWASAGAHGVRVVLSLPWQPPGSQPAACTGGTTSSSASSSAGSADCNSSADSKFVPLSREQRFTGASLASAGYLSVHAHSPSRRQQALPGELRASAVTASPAVSRHPAPSSCPQQGRRSRTPQHTTPGMQQGLEPWRLSAWLLKTDARTRPQTLVRRARGVNLSSGSGDDEGASTDNLSSSGSSDLNSPSSCCAAGVASISKVCAAALGIDQVATCVNS
jgi:hypothetical protein